MRFDAKQPGTRDRGPTRLHPRRAPGRHRRAGDPDRACLLPAINAARQDGQERGRSGRDQPVRPGAGELQEQVRRLSPEPRAAGRERELHALRREHVPAQLHRPDLAGHGRHHGRPARRADADRLPEVLAQGPVEHQRVLAAEPQQRLTGTTSTATAPWMVPISSTATSAWSSSWAASRSSMRLQAVTA